MESQQQDAKKFLLIELALSMASKDRTRFLDALGKLRNAEISADEVHSVLKFVSDSENISMSELLPSGGSKAKAGSCCGWEKTA